MTYLCLTKQIKTILFQISHCFAEELLLFFYAFFLVRCLTCDSATDRCSSRQLQLRLQLLRKQLLWQEISQVQAALEALHLQLVSDVATLLRFIHNVGDHLKSKCG